MKNLLEYQKQRSEALNFSQKDLTFTELQKYLHDYLNALKNTKRSSELAMKKESTVKQRIRHQINCEDLEFKRSILQSYIDNLAFK